MYEAEEDGVMYLAIVDKTNGTDGYKSKFDAFKIDREISVCLPGQVSDLAYTTSGADDNMVTLSWTNPTLNTFGEPFTIKALRVERDGEVVATLPADATSYAEAAPISGVHTYNVIVVGTDDTESKPAILTTGYVGPFEGVDVPCTLNFKNNIYADFWTLTAAEDSQEFVMDTNNDNINIAVSNLHPIDATASSPEIRLSADKAYKVIYKEAASNASNAINYSLSLLGAGEPLVLREMAKCDPPKTTSSSYAGGQNVEYIFSPTTSGKYKLAWHAEAEKMAQSYYSNTVSFSGIQVEEIPVLPTAATELKAATDVAAGTVALSWTNPSHSVTGIALSDLKATILRNGTAVATIDTEAGAAGNYTDTPDVEGYHSYAVVLSNANGEGEASATVTAPYVGAALSVPFAADFVNKAYQWLGAEYGDGANGNVFTLNPTVKAFFVTEKQSEFADALVSAPIHLVAGHTYQAIAKCSLSTSNYTDNAQLVLVNNLDELTEGAQVLAKTNISSSDKEMKSANFGVDATGDYYLAVKVLATSGSSNHTFYVKAFSLDQVATTPAAATIAAKSYYDEAVVDVAITLPTHSTDGVELREKLTANVYHGAVTDEPTATFEAAPGATINWRHTTPNVNAVNTYNVHVVLADSETHGAGGTSAVATAQSDWVGKAYHLPWTPDFADEAVRSEWTTYDGSGQTSAKPFAWNEEAEAWITQVGSNPTSSNYYFEEWLISPAIYILDNAKYTISFDAYASGGTGSTNYAPLCALYIGDSNQAAKFINAGTLITPSGNKLEKEAGWHTYSYDFSYDPEASDEEREQDFATDVLKKKFFGFQFGKKYNYSYPYVELKNIRFATTVQTGVDNVEASAEATLLYSNGWLSTTADDTITVYTLSGATVAIGCGSLDVDRLAPGLYIARSAKATLKFVKK